MSSVLRAAIGVTALSLSSALLAVPTVTASAASSLRQCASIASPLPGPQGPGVILVQFAQQARFSGGGFATVSDGQGDTFVSWTNFGKKGGVFLCTLRTGSTGCLNGIQTSNSTEASPAPGTNIHLLAGHRTVRLLWFDDSDRGASVQEA